MRDLWDLLVPPRCPGCRQAGGGGLCAGCASTARALVLPGLGFTHLDDGVAAIAAYRYEDPVRAALLSVKAGGQWASLGALTELLLAPLRTLSREGDPLSSGIWTWVPASRRKTRTRGGDVARGLAQGAARAFGDVPAVPLLRRVAERPDQTTLDAVARRMSPAGSFAAVRGVPGVPGMPRTVVLVDDVRTTGATIRAAAEALRAAGASRVLAVTLARAGAPGVRPGAPGVRPGPAGEPRPRVRPAGGRER